MRIEAVELVRYGHFSGRSLRFPRRDPDFHLILGRNEAGKSTLRQALRDLLFGIPMTTSMSFRYAGAELELGATLSGQPGELVFGRRRKRNGGLVNAQGEALQPDALRPWLGDVTGAFFDRMFGLDHRRLEQGGQAMLQASDNVDSVLFQAAAGVSRLNTVLDALREEASSLWAPRRSRDRAWYAAADRLAEAESALRAATVRPSAWAGAERESRRLEAAYEEAEADHSRQLAQVRKLEYLRRVAPLLAQIRELETRLQQQESGDGQASEGALMRRHEAEILKLDENRLRVADHRAAMQRCESRQELLHAQLDDVLRQLGRSAASSATEDLDTLAAALPSRPLRKEIGQLLQQGQQIQAQHETAQRALQERRDDLERLRSEMAALPAIELDPALRQILDEVEAVGDIDALRETALRRQARESAAWQRRLAALALPGVAIPDAALQQGADWLADMKPWPPSVLAEAVQRRQQFQADIDALDKRIREADLELEDAALQLEQFQRSYQAVSRDEVMAARRERDELWSTLVAGDRPIGLQAAPYETLVRHADTLADRQLAALEDAARLQTLQHEHERRQHSAQSLRAARELALSQRQRFETEWAEGCVQRHLPALAPVELQGWQAEREAALTAFQSLQEAQTEYAALTARHDSLFQSLCAALEATPSLVPASTLNAASAQARSLLQQAQESAAQRQALATQGARIEALLPRLEEDCTNHVRQRDEWTRRWQTALQQAGLPPTAQAAYIESALELLSTADELLTGLRESRAEHRRLAEELRGFRAAATQLAAALQDRGFESQAAESHVSRWMSELEQARAAAREHEAVRQRLAELNQRLLQEGEGRSRQEIENEISNVDISTLSIQSERLSKALEDTAARRSQLAVEREQARAALEAVSGAETAALAEARRQEALADMASIAERYIRLHAEYRLLERVTEQYRERRQGPLLTRAGQVFSELTLGAHAGLLVDTEAAALHARRADGSQVPLEGLSDGTRDQLYLALRLAALELYLDHAPPMPFIADDLFVNYDDRRSVAGLRALAQISQRTQVIFLTHHEHMVELAHEALGEGLRVLELDKTN